MLLWYLVPQNVARGCVVLWPKLLTLDIYKINWYDFIWHKQSYKWMDSTIDNNLKKKDFIKEFGTYAFT